MKKITGKIAVVLVLIMLAGTVSGCGTSSAQIADAFAAPAGIVVGGVGIVVEGTAAILDALIDTPTEKRERELWMQAQRALDNHIAQYDEVDTF